MRWKCVGLTQVYNGKYTLEHLRGAKCFLFLSLWLALLKSVMLLQATTNRRSIMLRLVSEGVAMERRSEFPGCFRIWRDARRYHVAHELDGGMPLEEAKAVVMRAGYAYTLDRVGRCCFQSKTRMPAGDFVPTPNCSTEWGAKQQAEALSAIKRGLRAWPICGHGGELAPVWDSYGVCTWECSVCK